MQTILFLLLAIPGVPTRAPLMQDIAYSARSAAQAAYGDAQQSLMSCVVTADAIRVITDQKNDARTLAFAIDILNAAQASMDFYTPAYSQQMEAGAAKLASVLFLESQSDKDRAYHDAAEHFRAAKAAMVEAKRLIDVRHEQLEFILNSLRENQL